MGRRAESWKLSWRRNYAIVRFRWQAKRCAYGLGYFTLESGARDVAGAEAAAALRYAEVVADRRKPQAAQLGLKPAPASIDVVIARWIEAVRGSYDVETLKTWVIYGRKWSAHFVSLVRVTEGSIGDYSRDRLRAVLRKSVLKELSALRNFLTWCKEQNYLAARPPFPELPKKATGVRSGTQRAEPVDVSPEEVARFLAVLPEESDRTPKFPVRAYFEALWYTGLRSETIESISVPQHYTKGATHLVIADAIDKSRYGRKLLLTPGARRALDRVCPEAGVIFGAHNWYKQFAKAAAKAEMPDGFAPYDLRHGRAAHLLSTTGDDILGVGYALGHKRPTTTDRYLRKNQRAGERVLAAVSAGELLGYDSGYALAGELAAVKKMQQNQGDRRGSNPRQLEPQSSALPTELRPPKSAPSIAVLRRVANAEKKIGIRRARTPKTSASLGRQTVVAHRPRVERRKRGFGRLRHRQIQDRRAVIHASELGRQVDGTRARAAHRAHLRVGASDGAGIRERDRR